MCAIKRALDSVNGPVPWDQRIVLGCWNVSYFSRLTPTRPEILFNLQLT